MAPSSRYALRNTSNQNVASGSRVGRQRKEESHLARRIRMAEEKERKGDEKRDEYWELCQKIKGIEEQLRKNEIDEDEIGRAKNDLERFKEEKLTLAKALGYDEMSEVGSPGVASEAAQDVEGEEKRDGNSVAWRIKESSPPLNTGITGCPRAVVACRTNRSFTTYLIRYGSPDAFSLCFESDPGIPIPPNLVNVAHSKDRIVEKIIKHHKEEGKSRPDEILRQVIILGIYWDSKQSRGHEAKLEGLHPDTDQKRPTRCLVYLNPDLYKDKDWGIDNITGFSHETRTTILSCVSGNNRRQRDITFFNTAVRLENRFEKHFMSNQPNRPDPQAEYDLEDDIPRRSSSRSIPKSSSRYQLRSQKVTPTGLSQSPTHSQSPNHQEIEERKRFHKTFLNLYELDSGLTLRQLEPELQVLYPAAWEEWRKKHCG